MLSYSHMCTAVPVCSVCTPVKCSHLKVKICLQEKKRLRGVSDRMATVWWGKFWVKLLCLILRYSWFSVVLPAGLLTEQVKAELPTGPFTSMIDWSPTQSHLRSCISKNCSSWCPLSAPELPFYLFGYVFPHSSTPAQTQQIALISITGWPQLLLFNLL